jgi:hypothetical protein
VAIVWKIPYTTDEIVGRQTTAVFFDAQQMLAIILKERNSLKGIYFFCNQ